MHGPAGSGINAYELAPHILKALASADVVLFKGARSYEMMQGLRASTYFAFSVLHTYTETVTGIDAWECPAVVVRQEPGVPSFDGFRARAWRKRAAAGDRVIGLARMTAVEYLAALGSEYYARLVASGPSRDGVNESILEAAEASGRSFAEVILEQDASLSSMLCKDSGGGGHNA